MKFAILGLGSIGRRHLRNIRAIMPHAELLGVDPAPQARDLARAHGATEVFEAAEPALHAGPMAALVCSPTALHAEHLKACVAQQVPVYVEKPIAARLTPEVVRALSHAERTGVAVVVAANLRYMPGAALLTQHVSDGQLGRLVGIYAHAGAYLPGWRPNREGRDYRTSYSASAQEGGAMRDYAHEFDLMRWWAGAVRTVSAAVRKASDLGIESEDVADLLLEFESGVAATLHVDYLERVPRRFIELLFTEGRTVWDIHAQAVEVVDGSGRANLALDLPRYDLDDCYREAFADFLRAVACPAQARHAQSGWDGAETLAVIDAARESAARRAQVEVEEIRARAGLGANPGSGIQNSKRHLQSSGRDQGENVHREPQFPSHSRSQALLVRARRVIPSATQTLSKGPSQFVQGPSPIYLQRGHGCRVWDADGHEYIDWIMGLGPIILGYGDPDVNAAVMRQLRDGPTFSLMHPLEVEVAELLVEVIPSAEEVRFLKTGSEACSAAMRIARAYTGREMIATNGYHGWHDWSAATLPLDRGVTESARREVVEFSYNDLESLERCFAAHPGEIALVILEPMCLEWPKDGFLQGVVDLAHEHGALVAFDEVITGFRWALGGAQEYFGVTPDLTALGKALANGLPLSAVVGRQEVMSELEAGAFVSLTHGGETLSLAAAKATIEKMRATGAVKTLWERGRRLRDALQDLLIRHELLEWYRLEGPPCRFAVTPRAARGVGVPHVPSILQQELVLRGVLFGGTHTLCLAHDETAIQQTIDAYADALPAVKRALVSGRVDDFLHGPPIQPVFQPRGSTDWSERDQGGSVNRSAE